MDRHGGMHRAGAAAGGASGPDLTALAGLGLSVSDTADGLDSDLATGVEGIVGQTAIGGKGAGAKLTLRGSVTSDGSIEALQPVTVKGPYTVTPALTLWSASAGGDNGHAILLLRVSIGASGGNAAAVQVDANGDMHYGCDGTRQRFAYGSGASFGEGGTTWIEWQGNGAYGGPYLKFYTAAVERLSVLANGDVVVGAGALAPSAQGGFLHIPSMSGPPTMEPAMRTGRVPLVIDNATPALWAYIAGVWRSATLT